MALDETVAHAGRRSACLTVCDPKQDNVYITRQIPIRGGALYEASCFVKTVDVHEASGGRPSVGAGLIVEWAGKDGKWLNAGEYACGCWGTTDWKLMTCKRLIAPENAGYAIVFLVKVVKELRAIRHLVTTEGPVVTGTAKVGEDSVEWWRKTVDGKQLFIAVNTADHPVSVQVELPDDTPRRLDLRRYEVRTEGFEPRTEQ